MNLDIIQNRLQEYKAKSKQEEENALKEIFQEIALAGLSRTDFFKFAAFQGGTCLRILYNLRRFSEDMDFVLKTPSSQFHWEPFLKGLETEFEAFGLHCELIDRSELAGSVKKAFLKEDSFGKVLSLNFTRQKSDMQRILIKLEIDTNPPSHSAYGTHFLEFPYPFSILCQDLHSLFAGKCHALLCREYVKGRDWYDFLWYVQRKTAVNLDLLKSALHQQGPFKNQDMAVSLSWLKKELKKKIATIDWTSASEDVKIFLSLNEQHHVNAWSKTLFDQSVDKLLEGH